MNQNVGTETHATKYGKPGVKSDMTGITHSGNTDGKTQTKSIKPDKSGMHEEAGNTDDPAAGSLLWVTDADVIKDVEYLPGGEIITVGPLADGIHVYSANGVEVDHPLSKLFSRYLAGVSVDETRSTVAVIESRGVDKPGLLHVCTSDDDIWEHREYDICNMPRFVANMTDGNVIVGDYHHVLHKYNTNGEKIWRKDPDNRIYDLTVDNRNRILVCHPNHVTVYDSDGTEDFSFCRSTNEKTVEPYGICVDAEDNILLADYNSSTVLLYTVDGKFTKELLNVDGTPCQMALHHDHYLSMCLDNSKLVMYKI